LTRSFTGLVTFPVVLSITSWSVKISIRLGAMISICLLSSCSPNESNTQSESVTLIQHDIADLMLIVIEPAAEKIWDSAGYILTIEGETNLAPTNDDEWMEVIHASAVLIESGNLLQTPGRRIEEPDWDELSQALSHAADVAKVAALEQDADALFKAGGTIYNVCRACHQQYWKDEPQRPSESL